MIIFKQAQVNKKKIVNLSSVKADRFWLMASVIMWSEGNWSSLI